MQAKGLPIFRLSLSNSMRNEATSGYCTKWRKRVKENGKEKYIWIKIGANTWGGYDHQSIGEVLVSYVAKDLGLDKYVLSYKPCICEFIDEAEMQTQRVIGCYSYEMIDPDEEELIPVSKLDIQRMPVVSNCVTKEEELLEKYNYFINAVCDKTGINKEEFRNYMDIIILLDDLVMNTDRALCNIAVIKNIHTGKYRIAPIFDTGQSFMLANDMWDESGVWSDAILDNVFTKNFLNNNILCRRDELLVVSRFFCTPEGIQEREKLAKANFSKTIQVIKRLYESVGFGADEKWTEEERKRAASLRLANHGRIDNPILLQERDFMINLLLGRKRTVLDGYKPTIVPKVLTGFDKTTFEMYSTGKFKD